ncbi:uncharacterized protein LOC135336897 [Halichondria panicea]|uniref:uncharacterized protein LOC135336897 n=1 Tax=Halichondria panicea TaxID=6063 RepID=UPI00312BA51D
MDYRDRLSVVLLVVTLLSCPNHLDCTSMATVVVPGNFTDACPQEHCSTINDLPSSIFNNSIQLYFLSGQHLLQRHISMHDVSSGHVQISSSCSSPQCNPTILCQGGPTGMSFQNIQTVEIAGLTFSGCTHQGEVGFGGAISFINVTNISIVNCHFVGNHITGNTGGGALYVFQSQSVSIRNSSFVNNYAYLSIHQCSGAAFFQNNNFVLIQHTLFKNNTATSGGAIFADQTDLTLHQSSFFQNNATDSGGAVDTLNSLIVIIESEFESNLAILASVINARNTTISILSSSFLNNTAVSTGCIYIQDGSVVRSNNSAYSDNVGSVYIIIKSSSFFVNNTFVNNQVGGVLVGSSCSFIGIDNAFINNSASNTNIYMTSCNSSFLRNHFIKNGAAGNYYDMLFQYGSLSMSETTYAGNFTSGAIIVASVSTAFFADSSFKRNKLKSTQQIGSAISVVGNVNLTVLRSNFSDNQAAFGGGTIALIGATVDIKPVRILISDCYFFNNNAAYGGAIYFTSTGTDSECIIRHSSFVNNTADYGGAIFMLSSTFTKIRSCLFRHNVAKYWGGAVNIRRGQVKTFDSRFLENFADEYGGAIAIKGDITTTQCEYINIKMCFSKNNATYGGALYSIDTKLNIVKQEENETSKILFTENSAVQGGAIYVMDVIQDCETRYNARKECFLQTLLNRSNVTRVANNYFNVYFINNTASLSSNAIFGGLLDRCSLNPANKLLLDFPNQTFLSGADYILATAQFAGLIDYSNLTTNYNPEKVLQAVSGAIVNNFISSEPLQVCYCFGYQPNCSDFQHAPVYVKKGQLFSISVIAVDQVGNPVNATVISSVVTGSRLLNSNKALQRIPAECSLLEYSLIPDKSDRTADIELFADGPCNNIGVSKRTLNVIFQPCICPIGFQQRETRTHCFKCECDEVLQSYITSCFPENETVLRRPNVWIDYVNTSTKSGYLLYPNCPFDYCVDELVSVNLNTAHGADSQCVFNRTGTLCGACKKNLSAVLGSSQCRECTNSYISLLIPFAMAGIALVAFVVLFNLTVTTGTINGLIFYANMIFANRSLFVPSGTPGLLRIFISWLNLDLGIETCFFNGMDSYAKVLLQLVFPSYILILTVLIIMLCEYSVRFSTFIGKKRDPVGTLCTLILLSYSKFIRTIIASLQHAYLNYPDGSSETVWLYDANVPYFKPSHAPRFITVSVIIILGLVYTVLLLFGQWLTKLGRWIPFRWVNNPKYNEFIVKYHTQLKPKHRYWVGLLLLVRISYYTVSAFVSQSAALLSLILIVLILLSLKHISSHVYEVNAIDNLESAFLVNLGVLAACLYFLQDSEGIPHIAASISITVSAFLFIVIFGYHAHTFILKNTRLWISIIALLRPVWVRMRGLVQCPNLRRNADIDLQEEEIEHEENQLLLQELPYAQGESDDEEQHPYEAPIIQPAVRDSQPRNQDLEQLFQPITARDYRRFQEPVRPQQPTTYSVVEID